MASFWIGDAQGRVLGPLTMEVLRDLITSGRVRGIARVSNDGAQWAAVEAFPEITRLQDAQSSEALRPIQREQATRLRTRLESLRGLPPNEIFGIPADASIEQYRAAFFRLVKQFYPDRLPHDADPELRRTTEEIFTFLSRLMAFVEHQPPTASRTGTGSTTPPPVLERSDKRTVGAFTFRRDGSPAAPGPGAAPAGPETRAAAAPPRKPRPLPTYELREFVGIERRGGDRVTANVRVTIESCGIFTENKLLNISQGGAFIPCDEVLTLGSAVDLVFDFEDPNRKINASGNVVWWSAGDAKQARGFGVKFTRIAKEDVIFIRDFVLKVNTSR